MSKSDTIDGGWFIHLFFFLSGPPRKQARRSSKRKMTRGFLFFLPDFLSSFAVSQRWNLSSFFSFSLENRSCSSRWDFSSLSHTHSAARFEKLRWWSWRSPDFHFDDFSPRLLASPLRFSSSVVTPEKRKKNGRLGERDEEFYNRKPTWCW